MNSGLTKLGASLIAVFAICLVVLAADIAYVIWRRRRFHRRSSPAGDSVTGGDSSVYVLSSKELLYFLCWKNQSRIEPNDHHHQVNSVNGADPSRGNYNNHRDHENAADSEDDDVLKFQHVYGQTRLLFTIKEEEENNTTADQRSVVSDGRDQPEYRDQLDDVEVPEVSLTVEPDDAGTPFSTPCASPPFYTPSPSPSRDDVKRAHDSYGEVEFASLDLEFIGV